MTEQFVGQELSQLCESNELFRLNYWVRNQKGSTAEVDYLLQQDKALPIEVKSGKTGTLKSLHLFLKEKNSPLGIRVSEAKYGKSETQSLIFD